MRRLALLSALLLLSAPAAGQEEDPPATAHAAEAGDVAARAVVESFHELLLSCMQEADELGFQGRYERILATLDETFDLPFMARTAVGAAWNQLSRDERVGFVALSRRLSASRYADNFSGYDGERFETDSEEPAARGTALVKTRFERPRDEPVRFDYRLRRIGDEWRIIDVQLDGKISELALRRGQYRSVIQRDGFAKLEEALEKKIAELSEE
jgi:phospholipid transport system substrate-binding protein